MYHHRHFTADTSRLNDQVGTVGGQMETRMQISWMSNPHMLLGITHTHTHTHTHTLYLDLCYQVSETSQWLIWLWQTTISILIKVRASPYGLYQKMYFWVLFVFVNVIQKTSE